MIGVDPVDDRLVVDREDATDAAEVSAFEVKAHRLALDVFAVAKRQRLRRVDACAGAALITLTAAQGTAVGSLVCCRFAMGASAHAVSLQHNFDLDTPVISAVRRDNSQFQTFGAKINGLVSVIAKPIGK